MFLLKEARCMSESYRSKLPVACPRCKVKLPPGETTCYKCGFQIARVRPTNQKRRTLIYFICVFLFLVVSAAYIVRSTGISFSALFSRPTASHRIAYPLPTGTPLFADNFSSDANG